MKQDMRHGLYFTAEDFRSIPADEKSSISDDVLPLVSVLMLAYNHEAHIRQAVESILAQESHFHFEVIIGEDCSRDKTREICFDYQKRYPEIVRVVFSEENVGMHRNFARIWHRAKGKYIAVCEGDDYWIDPKKLAKQASWMEAMPEFSLCGTYTKMIRETGISSWSKEGLIGPAVIKERYTLEDLISTYSFHFSSIMLRKEIVRFPLWFWDVYCVDRTLYLLCAESGSVGFLPEITSVYRLHEGGIWSPSDNLSKASKGIRLFENIDRHFAGRYRKLIRQTLGNIIWSYMAESLEASDRTSARKLFWLSMRYRFPMLEFSVLKLQAAVFMRLYFSLIYK